MVRVVGKPKKFVDGFGLEFSPDRHWFFLRVALERHAREESEPPPPATEPVWKDRPAGAKCVPLYEDKECAPW